MSKWEGQVRSGKGKWESGRGQVRKWEGASEKVGGAN